MSLITTVIMLVIVGILALILTIAHITHEHVHELLEMFEEHFNFKE